MTPDTGGNVEELAPIHRYGPYGEQAHRAMIEEREQTLREEKEKAEHARLTREVRERFAASIRKLRVDLGIPARRVAEQMRCSLEEYVDLEDGAAYDSRRARQVGEWLLSAAEKRYGARHLKGLHT